MENKKNFIKVRVSLILKEGDKISINEDATFNASDEFSDRIYTSDEKFRSAIITFINDAIGLHNWAVTFEQFDTDDYIYHVKIYSENENDDGVKIKNIIESRITDKKLYFRYGGTINDYLKNP